ncbi:MAG: Lactate utilization protein C [Rhodocyclaceae bacterium]|jgi:L-lactate dehydrogenase complex protein LldG|nr:Lactate utilization protein C [Rhodocyclaceae bacterium]
MGDMGDSRDDILGRMRRRLGRTAENATAGRAAIDAVLARRAQGPRPDVGQDLLARFIARAETAASTVDTVACLAEAPAAVARYLDAQKLPRAAVAWPELAGLDWAGAGLDVGCRAATGEDLTGITGVFCAVAETGSLMVLSGPETPASTSLLPETHIALVPASRIVAGMEEAWQLIRHAAGELPRAVNFISGPSRTGDIEQTLVLGAHGPYRVHIVVVSGQ